jgi:hypothetical protein
MSSKRHNVVDLRNSSQQSDADYISDVTKHLVTVAVSAKLETLAYLLSIAELEARNCAKIKSTPDAR